MEQLLAVLNIDWSAFVAYAETQPWGIYVFMIIGACRLFVTFAPASMTEKVPDWLMVLINKVALSSNGLTDNKGNKIK